MQRDVRERHFPTMRDAFGRDSAYWGDREDWLILYMRHRDSEPLDNANFDAMHEDLESRFPDDVAVERATRWAYGWREYLLVNPANLSALAAYIDYRDRLAIYPIIDEERVSEYEREVDEGFLPYESYEYGMEYLQNVRGYDEESARCLLLDLGVEIVEEWEA